MSISNVTDKPNVTVDVKKKVNVKIFKSKCQYITVNSKCNSECQNITVNVNI